MAKAIESQGTKLAYSIGSPTEFTNIGNITSISGLGGGSAPVIDASNLDSTFKEKLMGLPDEGQISVSLNLDPDNATHQAMRTARTNRTRVEFKVTLTDTSPATGIFYGYVLMFRHDIAVGSQVKGALTIEVDGQVTWA